MEHGDRHFTAHQKGDRDTYEKCSDNALGRQLSKVRNRIRHETNPQVLSENRLDWAEITRQIQSLCQRIKRFQRIQRDTPRLLNLLKTELRARMLQNLKTVKALGKDSREIFAVVDKYYFTIL